MDAVVKPSSGRAPGRSGVDPITLEVIRHGVVSITDQIDANITRTAFSPYIYEYKDFAVGMTDEDGQLVGAGDLEAQARRIGAWLGVSLSASAVQAQSAAFRDHMTSADPAASVARWRSELSAADAALFTDQLLGELLGLGYPLD